MVRKLIATLGGGPAATWPNEGKVGDNEHLFKLLQQYRGMIGDNFTNKKWDRNKKLANEYELVYTMFFGYPSICAHIPISRSFFKMWEIMADFAPEMPFLGARQPIRATFLAEGPGGFMEAFMHKRSTIPDMICGMTLISPDNSVPKWKTERLVRNYPGGVLFDGGVDGTGSLYNMDNIACLVMRMGPNQCMLITADGGFDFSTDFNNQERLSQRLIACEVFAALRLQAPGGALVLKIYDIHNPVTFQLLWILKQCYEKIHIHKPLTSRPANSEKYVVCTGFAYSCFQPPPVSILNELYTFCTATIPPPNSLTEPPASFMQTVVHLNHYFVMRQIMNIHRTLLLIKKDKKDITAFRDVVKVQLSKAIRWCNKYKMPINLQALHEYRSLMHEAHPFPSYQHQQHHQHHTSNLNLPVPGIPG